MESVIAHDRRHGRRHIPRDRRSHRAQNVGRREAAHPRRETTLTRAEREPFSSIPQVMPCAGTSPDRPTSGACDERQRAPRLAVSVSALRDAMAHIAAALGCTSIGAGARWKCAMPLTKRHAPSGTSMCTVRGLLDAKRRCPDLASSSYLHAIQVARKQRRRSLELRAATALARHWAEAGRTSDAVQMVQLVHDGFTEGFSTWDLKQAKSLLGEHS